MTLSETPPTAPSIVREPKDLIRVTRQEHGLTLEAMGAIMGVTREAVRLFENGARNPAGMPEICELIALGDDTALNFWLDLDMLRYRRRKLNAILELRAADPIG